MPYLDSVLSILLISIYFEVFFTIAEGQYYLYFDTFPVNFLNFLLITKNHFQLDKAV